MKVFAIVFVLCFTGALGSLTPEQSLKLIEYKTQCMAETGVEQETIEKAITGELTEKDEKLDCFISCILKKFKIMNEDGTLNEEIAKQQAPASISKEHVDDMINKCKDITGGNDCEKAANLVECFFQNKALKLH